MLIADITYHLWQSKCYLHPRNTNTKYLKQATRYSNNSLYDNPIRPNKNNLYVSIVKSELANSSDLSR